MIVLNHARTTILSRRDCLRTALALCASPFTPRLLASPPQQPDTLETSLAQLEQTTGGRLGVALLNTTTGSISGLHTTERFPLCSTFKLLAVAALLHRVDLGQETLTRPIPITAADILAYAPVTQQHVGSTLTLAELCAAALTLSDNTAANLILTALGGPPAVTAFARSLGDPVTRLDRNEPTLNQALPGDPRDTTTPAAMAATVSKLVLGDALTPASRTRLTDWLIACQTGAKKIRAGFPPTWRTGDKTGSGERGTSNDVAILWPPTGKPLILAVYLTGAESLPPADRDAINAKAAHLVYQSL